jgi:hypothetical protein
MRHAGAGEFDSKNTCEESERKRPVLELLADVNCEGLLQALRRAAQQQIGQDVWTDLDVAFCDFGELGLSVEMIDAELWHYCQAKRLVLVTANRNEDDETSLGAAIRRHNTADSMPVITVADGDRLSREKAYCARAAVRLVELLMDFETVKGAGRLFVP